MRGWMSERRWWTVGKVCSWTMVWGCFVASSGGGLGLGVGCDVVLTMGWDEGVWNGGKGLLRFGN